jgi:fructokinase
MRNIYGLGETVFDIIFKNKQPITAKAGGSVLNALVSLARLRHNVNFISELGNDKVGDIIINFLKQNNINTSNTKRYSNGQSALAMAFLNENNDAEYDFYKNYPKNRLTGDLPDFKPDDIFLFGSFYAIDPTIREQAYRIIQHAHQCKCILVYDPNFRNKHADILKKYAHHFEENMLLADIVRGSNEDFMNIFATPTANQTYNRIQNKCPNLVYTANANGVHLHTQDIKKHYAVPQLIPVNTIGAGDNFNAGIIHAILDANILKKDIPHLTEKDWNKIIKSGIKLSSEVCMSMENYICS